MTVGKSPKAVWKTWGGWDCTFAGLGGLNAETPEGARTWSSC